MDEIVKRTVIRTSVNGEDERKRVYSEEAGNVRFCKHGHKIKCEKEENG